MAARSASSARERLTDKIAGLTSDQLLAAVVALSGGEMTTDKRLVRALMIDEFARREGVAAADVLMDRIGL